MRLNKDSKWDEIFKNKFYCKTDYRKNENQNRALLSYIWRRLLISFSRGKIWKRLQKRETLPKLIRTIKNVYRSSKSYERTNNMQSIKHTKY